MSISRPTFSCHFSQNCYTTRQTFYKSVMEVRHYFSHQQLQTSKYQTVVKTNGRQPQSLTIVTNTLVLSSIWIQLCYRRIERQRISQTGQVTMVVFQMASMLSQRFFSIHILFTCFNQSQFGLYFSLYLQLKIHNRNQIVTILQSKSLMKMTELKELNLMASSNNYYVLSVEYQSIINCS